MLLAISLISCLALVRADPSLSSPQQQLRAKPKPPIPAFNPPSYTPGQSSSGLLQQVLSPSSSYSPPSHGDSFGLEDFLHSGADTGAGICQPTGVIEDAQCDYETVEAINADFFHRLSGIVQQRYFRYYKVDLYKDCPFWIDNTLCMNRDCTVQKADEVSRAAII